MTTRPADGLPASPLNILVIAASLAPSVSIGILRPMLSLERAGVIKWRMLMENSWCLGDIRAADIVIFCRNQSVDAYSAALLAKHEGKKVIYEVDDNFFEVPINTSLAQIHRRPLVLHTMRRMFELADVTRVYSSKMAELARSFGARVHHNKVYFDTSLTKNVPPNRSSDKVRIAFATGRTPDPLVEQALEEALSDIIEMRPDRVEVHFWRSPSSLLRDRPQVIVNQGVADYNVFIRKFYESGYDIGLAPLLSTLFYESKTNSKYREYGGCGVAGVYSNAAPYAECVVPEKTGLLVDNSRQGWRDAILRLVDNKQLRQLIAVNARADVEHNYSYLGYLKTWQESLRRAVTRPTGTPDIKPLLFHRNIAISKKSLGSLRGYPKDLQIQSIRGAEWSTVTHFMTNFIVGFGSSNLLEGSGIINWMVAEEPESIDETSLREIHQAGIRIICDVRSCNTQNITDLVDRLASRAKDIAIVVCNPEQLAALGHVDHGELLARVEHPYYPRPQRFPTSFGYSIVSPKSRGLLDSISLTGQAGLWLEIMDTISTFHPLGRPVALKLPRGYFGLSMNNKLRYLHHFRPQELIRSAWLRGSIRIQRLRWQQLRWMIPSDAELENQIRQSATIQHVDPSIRPEKMDQ